MFEAEMKQKVARILNLKTDKVRFDLPSSQAEQEMAFIEISRADSRIVDKLELARVTGRIRLFVQNEKMPYGYFNKAIDKAAQEDKEGFFFFDFEENASRYLNLTERTASFVYFHKKQYDPEKGAITSIEFSEVPHE